MNLLFSSGTARGGTNLRTYALNAHPAVALSIDAFLPLFKYYRSRIIDHKKWENQSIPEDWNKPLPELINSPDELIRFMRFQKFAEDVRIPLSHWSFLHPELESRSSLASGLLSEKIKNIRGDTFVTALLNYSELIAQTYSSESCELVGFHENWISEFFLPLSKLFPDARFVSYIRDPRAVLHSSEIHEFDIKKHPAVLSMTTHTRKHNRLTLEYKNIMELSGRFIYTKYEDFIDSPISYIHDMCNFLSLSPHDSQTDFLSYRSGSGKKIETPFSVYKDAIGNWNSYNQKVLTEISTFFNFYEMKRFDYLHEDTERENLSKSAIHFLTNNMKSAVGWKEFEYEVEKRIKWEMENFNVEHTIIGNRVE